jgi:type IV pilus assembly protein PilW
MNTPRSAVRGALGHTLLELTIALALGLLVVAATLSLYRSQRAAFERATDAARIHDAAAAALDILGQQIQMAGYAADGDSTAAPLFGCARGRVTGADSAAACETLTGHSDGVQVRYAADAVATWPTGGGTPTDCIGQAVPDAYVTNRFYAKASTSSGEPELYCEGGGRQAQPLVEGIERIGAAYWLADAPQALDASALPRARWPDVYAVDLCVLVRGFAMQPKRRTGYVDCDGSPAFADDGRARQPFWRRVAIRNSTAFDGPDTRSAP